MTGAAESPVDLRLRWLDGRYAICRLDATASVPAWARGDGPDEAATLLSVTRTGDELSIICDESLVPTGAPDVRVESGWAALRVVGTLDFAVVGVLARLSSALAQAGVSIVAMSTFDTDLLLVRAVDVGRAEAALQPVAALD